MKRYYKQVDGKTVISNDYIAGYRKLEFEVKQEYLNGGCPDNIVWNEDGSPRLRTAEEQVIYLEQCELDAMTSLTKLELSRALKSLNLWKEEIKPLIKSNEDFEDDWNNAVIIDLGDPVFQQAFALTSIDLDVVKKEIIKNR
jgi:hypothetical protein